MANTDVTYTVTVKEVRRKVLPELDDEFAKDVGEFDSLGGAARPRARPICRRRPQDAAKRQVRTDLLKQLAERVTFELPASLVEREIDRRLEEFARQLMQQNVDPRQAGIDWAQFREASGSPRGPRWRARWCWTRSPGAKTLRSRPKMSIRRSSSSRCGRAAPRRRCAPSSRRKAGWRGCTSGLRREKAVDLALSRAKITDE